MGRKTASGTDREVRTGKAKHSPMHNWVVIDTVVSKYADHVPLYRQSAILERETGIELSRATLDGWVMRVGELLSPIAASMGQELLKGDYIQADETPVDVQMHVHVRRGQF